MKHKTKALTIISLLTLSSFSYGDYVIKFNNNQSKGMIPEKSVPETYSSCKDILDNGQSIGDGVYTINVNSKEFDVYCDMTSAGGGWTMVVAQLEQDPVTNWNEGIQADYDPSLSTNKGFALNTQEIPGHIQTAFGKDLDADFVDYVNYKYKTTDLSKQVVFGVKNQINYHIHRSESEAYGSCDPENSFIGSSWWKNALTFDRTGSTGFDWCFFTKPNRNYRGYSMNGDELGGEYIDFAWTVWVR